MVELLAPAGDLEKLRFAYLYGADACYIGGKKFSLRANANNFSLEDIQEAVKIAHDLKKKLYITVNIIFHDEELNELDDYLKKLADYEVDAIIASDIIVFKRVLELNLKLEVHVSTQASICNSGSALFYKDLGAKRLVLAREASLNDIKEIKNATNLELECFIHGAMCTSFSGRCVLSNVCTNRDSNRGCCAQVCRWTFTTPSSTYPFSIAAKDLNLIEYLKEMIELGVNSFKVEGRMRGIYYIATIILVYRRIIDKILNNSLLESEIKYYLAILNRCANRESAPQFVDGLPGKNQQYFLGREEVSNQDFLGLVLDYDKKNNLVILEERNYFKVGDVVEFFGPKIETFAYNIEEIFDEKMMNLEVANHPGMIIKLRVPKELNKYDMMRLKVIDKDNYL